MPAAFGPLEVGLPPDAPLLADGAKVGGWWRTSTSDPHRLTCELCPRTCSLKEGDRGFCFVRENRDGQIVLATYGKSTGFCIDPIEKKPLFHFLPGTSVLSFGTAGCNLGCKFCQNWSISKSREVRSLSEKASPESIAEAAVAHGCRSVAMTYNDPVVWAEYAIDTAKACRERGVKTVAVTAGYIGADARPTFFKEFDAANVDLKGFTEDFYQKYTLSSLKPVLETLIWLRKESQVWFEITNLLIPRANDSADEIARMCDWIVTELGEATPLHFTAFHPDFRLLDRPATPAQTLEMAHSIARKAGLRFVYLGNIDAPGFQTTYCPSCRLDLVSRYRYDVLAYNLVAGACPRCRAPVPGFFENSSGHWGSRRQRVRMDLFTKQ